MRTPALLVVVLSAFTFACSGAETNTPANVAPTDPPADDPVDPPQPPASDAGKGGADATPPPPPPPPPAPKSTGTGTYDSNMSDYAIKVVDVMANYEVDQKGDGTYEAELNVYLEDTAGRCAAYTASHNRKNTKYVKMEIAQKGATAAAAQLKPGKYVIDGSNVEFSRRTTDAMCVGTVASIPFSPAAATVREIVLTTISTTHATGTYEIRASDGRYMKGSFDVELCPKNNGTTSFTCQ